MCSGNTISGNIILYPVEESIINNNIDDDNDNIHIFSIKSDDEVPADILNVTFSISRPGASEEEYMDPAFVQHKIYLNLDTLIRLSTIEILPFDDNICIREPCLNFEHCQTRLMFGSAKHFVDGESILFRSIHPVKTHSCECPLGFTGEKNHYICNIEVMMMMMMMIIMMMMILMMLTSRWTCATIILYPV